MIKLISVEESKFLEEAADKDGLSYDTMMQNAGMAVAQFILGMATQQYQAETSVLVLVGSGNNGGDGLVAAARLAELLPTSTIMAYLMKARPEKDTLMKDAVTAGVSIVKASKDSKDDYDELRDAVRNSDFIIDAIFGTGTRLPIEGNAAEILTVVRETLASTVQEQQKTTLSNPALPNIPQETRPYVVAVDCPSGVNSDTGAVDPVAIRADATVTFIGIKKGLLEFPAAEYTGQIFVGDIGFKDEFEPLNSIKINVADSRRVAQLLPNRPANSYKGTFGKVLVVGGSVNYVGAPYLAASAAYRVGAGWVSVGAPQVIIQTLATMLPEATWILLAHEMGVLHENAEPILRKELSKYDVLLLGPGMGQEPSTRKFFEKLLTKQKPEKVKSRGIGFSLRTDESTDDDSKDDGLALPPMVIDADGLNLLASLNEWWTLLPEGSILTPHVGEFVRLAGMEGTNEQSAIEQVQSKRIDMALDYAKKWNTVVVLKGAFTVVASPLGDVTIMPFATAALATAGTGDVLAGIILGLRGQGLSAYDAAVAGTWLHGCAAVICEDMYHSSAPIIAGDIVDTLSMAIASTQAVQNDIKRYTI